MEKGQFWLQSVLFEVKIGWNTQKDVCECEKVDLPLHINKRHGSRMLDDLAVKPYILHKSLFQRICCIGSSWDQKKSAFGLRKKVQGFFLVFWLCLILWFTMTLNLLYLSFDLGSGKPYNQTQSNKMAQSKWF